MATGHPKRVPLPFDARLIGVWSRGCVDAPADCDAAAAATASSAQDDVRILYMPDFTGRYETWFHGLNEVVTFRWSPPDADRVTMTGIDYQFRDGRHVRREPCDWHFEAIPYWIADERVADGRELRVLRLKFGAQRVDLYGLITTDFNGFEHPHFSPQPAANGAG